MPIAVPYVWVDVQHMLLVEGRSQRYVAKHYNRSVSSFNEWYNNEKARRDDKKVHIPTMKKKKKPVNNDGKRLNNDDVTTMNYRKYTVEEISEIKYGDLPPTGYVSTLSHNDWGRYYCLFEWEAKYLEDLAETIWNTQKVLVKIGRDHGKTWTMIKLWARWGPEVMTRIIAVATQAKYAEIHYAVYNIWMSPRFRRDYGDIIKKASLNNGITFVDSMKPRVGPNFIIKGADGAITGLHFETQQGTIIDYEDGTFDLIPGDNDEGGWFHLEDIVIDLKVGESAEKRVKHWFRRTVRYIRGQKNKFTANGTAKDPDDLYIMMEEVFYWPVVLMKALEVVSGRLPTKEEITVDKKKGIVLTWPKDVGEYKILDCPNWPLEKLLFEFIYYPEDAQPELNNNPLNPSGNYFEGSKFLEVEMGHALADCELDNPKECKKHEAYSNYIVMDPAFGGSSTSSKTAILVLSILRGILYIRDAFVGEATFDEKEDIIWDFYNKYDPLQTFIEDNFRQVSRSFNRNTSLQNVPGKKLIQSRTDKKERIGALRYPFKEEEILFSQACPYLGDIKEEYLTFSLDDSPTIIRTKYNALDALSIGYKQVRSFLKRSERDEQRGNSKAWTSL